MLNYYADNRRAPRITKMMEATVAEDPPGAEVVVSGWGKIGSSALHLAFFFFKIYLYMSDPNLLLEQKQTSMLVIVEMLSLLGKVASSTLKQEFGCSLQ